jgi:S-adenosylhomocysteine hydrolase
MEYNYPLLKKAFDRYFVPNIDLSNTRLYSCMHLLEPQGEMYKYFIKFGFIPKNITVLGKIYSSNEEIIREIKSQGINVVQPVFNIRPFDIEHAENCKDIASNVKEGFKNIILDDGGYLIHEAKSKMVNFAVEQTSSGFRKLENDVLNFPVLNVARSKTKLTQESPLVARQIFERISEYMRAYEIKEPNITIAGLGPIGESTFQLFKQNSFNISGFDIEMSKGDLVDHLKATKPDIVIGATGSTLLSGEDLDQLEGDHIFHFISVSSSDREFPVSKYRTNELPHDDIRYKNFVFANNGFPITFKGLRNELTPPEIEKTIALLMGSVFYGVSQNIGEVVGFVDVPKELEELVNS